MSATAIIISIVMLFGFAGGGGSSSGGSSSSSSSSSSYSSSSSGSGGGESSPVVTAISFMLLIAALIYTAFAAKRQGFLDRDHNSTSHEQQVHDQARQIFENYQSDWSNFNYKNIKTYATDHYYAHASLMLDLLHEMHRVNQVGELKVQEVKLIDAIPENAEFPKKIRIKFYFDGLDQVIDTATGKELYRDKASYVEETWNFIYDGKNLKLDGISQPTESASHLVRSLATFAEQNGMYYSPDWGRYCLPSRGLIFGGATMKVSDINNHIIGRWGKNTENIAKTAEQSALRSSDNRGEDAKQSALRSSDNRGGLLAQLYTYYPYPDYKESDYYIVGQINVPKSYLGVIVKSKKFKTAEKPDKSYEKFELEWPDFNKRYEVYAASRDALPAFELLDPTFMEFLYGKNPSYNLEVADDAIYIYAKLKHITEQDYADLLSVLHAAHKRLKM